LIRPRMVLIMTEQTRMNSRIKSNKVTLGLVNLESAYHSNQASRV
jgi:hypothetical protein